MQKLKFTSVQLLSFSRDGDGGKAKFSASFTKAVQAAMEWTDTPECLTQANLDGELSAAVLTLTPNDEALKRNAIDLENLKDIGHFQAIRLELEQARGKGHRFELRFTVGFADAKGARKLEEYILTAGKSTMHVSYEPQAKQQDLPGVDVSKQGGFESGLEEPVQ